VQGQKRAGKHSAVAGQQLPIAEKVSPRAANRLGGQGGELAAEVGFVKGAEVDSGAMQTIPSPAELPLVADAANDDEGMFVIGREEGPDGLQAGVTGLNDLLRMG
jgi:hypothetical protein